MKDCTAVCIPYLITHWLHTRSVSLSQSDSIRAPLTFNHVFKRSNTGLPGWKRPKTEMPGNIRLIWEISKFRLHTKICLMRATSWDMLCLQYVKQRLDLQCEEGNESAGRNIRKYLHSWSAPGFSQHGWKNILMDLWLVSGTGLRNWCLDSGLCFFLSVCVRVCVCGSVCMSI